MNPVLSEREEVWVSEWLAMIIKLPAPLLLMVDADAADDPVVAVLPTGAKKQAQHTRWINRFRRHLEAFPEGEGWLLANGDGWHFGKGKPTVTSSAGYGAYGARSHNSDDYEAHYLQSVMLPCGSVPDGYEVLAVFSSDQGTRQASLIHG